MGRILIADMIIGNENRKILMLGRNFYPQNKLDLLGGYVHGRESAENAAVREAKEESGFDVLIIRKLGEYDYFDRGEKRMHVFIGKIIGGELQSSKEGTPMWIDPENLKPEDLAFPQVHMDIIKDYLKQKI